MDTKQYMDYLVQLQREIDIETENIEIEDYDERDYETNLLFVGDRVRCISDGSDRVVPVGATGVIVDASSDFDGYYLYVQWDSEFISRPEYFTDEDYSRYCVRHNHETNLELVSTQDSPEQLDLRLRQLQQRITERYKELEVLEKLQHKLFISKK
jgi:hypothetical protein